MSDRPASALGLGRDGNNGQCGPGDEARLEGDSCCIQAYVPVSFIELLFFFSSRRRHTRCSRDWSSDVCSSDLKQTEPTQQPAAKKPSWPYRSTGRRAVEGSVHRVGRSAGKMDVLWRLPSHTKLLFYTNAFTLAVIG